MALSSTIRARKPFRFSRFGGTSAPTSDSPNLAVKWNVEPLPSSLSIAILPPIASTSCIEIARPKPVPPYFRLVEPSACEKG